MELREQVFQESPLRVDAENGVLYGVKLLGEVSRNGRRYQESAMKAAVPLYEGQKGYADHPGREAASEDRKFRDLIGVFKNVRYESGRGIFGDAHLLKSGQFFNGIIEAAQKFPKAVGFSHRAEGESHYDGDTEIIESIKEVYSVDLVTDPATTAGLFESVKPRKTFREVVDALPDEHKSLRKRLTEMMGSGYMDGDFSLGNSKDQPTDPLSQIAAMLEVLVAALADVSKAAVKASKPDPAAPPPVGGAPGNVPPENGGEDSEDEEMSDEDKQKIEAFESLTRENAELKAKTMLVESGRQPTPARTKALANCATDDERTELLESWPKADAGGRPERSPGLVESEAGFVRGDTKKFASALR